MKCCTCYREIPDFLIIPYAAHAQRCPWCKMYYSPKEVEKAEKLIHVKAEARKEKQK